MGDFTHLDESGEASMVDVGDKDVTSRRAVARGRVYMQSETLEAIRRGETEKGEVEGVARIAGVMGGKRTSELVPLCHAIPIDHLDVSFELLPEDNAVDIVAEAATDAKTGVEMEALTAVNTAALTIYDMCKSMDRQMHIGAVHLVEKTGGSSGDFQHPDPPVAEPRDGDD